MFLFMYFVECFFFSIVFFGMLVLILGMGLGCFFYMFMLFVMMVEGLFLFS